MASILSGSDLEEAVKWMEVAIEIAKQSPCERDKRGVVTVNENSEIGRGFNAPPPGFICESKYCTLSCKDYTIHAEMNAIADATKKGNGQRIVGARMYHARVENGFLVESRKPRCYQCSKHLVAFGLGEFVLKHQEGLTLYPIEEFNRLSLESMK